MTEQGQHRLREPSVLGAVCLALIGLAVLIWLASPSVEATDRRPASVAPSGDARALACAPAVYVYPLTIPLEFRDTYGPRRLRPGDDSRYDFHRGIDWPVPAGISIPVHAVTTGTVVSFNGDWRSGIGSGRFVQLEHAEIDCETRYNHLAQVADWITTGMAVSPGQVIGWAGRTGSLSEMLHFEVRQGVGGTQRAAIHPLLTPFLPWEPVATPAVTVTGVFTGPDGLTALVEVSSPVTEPDLSTVEVTVAGAVTDARTIDFRELNAATAVVADLDDPLVRDVCLMPADLNAENGYRIWMAFRRLVHGPSAAVTARASDVRGASSTDAHDLTAGLRVTPAAREAEAGPGQTVTLSYTLTNELGYSETFLLSHLSAQGWPALLTPESMTLDAGQSATVTVHITLLTGRFGPPDCGLLVARVQSEPRRLAAGFYRLHRSAHVSTETGGDHPACGAADDPCATIAFGIHRTDAGGTVHVAEGTYLENILLTDTVHLLASYPTAGEEVGWTTRYSRAYSTTVDGGLAGPVLTIDGDYGPRVEGLTLVHGFNGDQAGGGVRIVGGAAPELTANWILDNSAALCGGGVYMGAFGTLPVTIQGNTITGNASLDSGGGGLCLEGRPARVEANQLIGNSAEKSGGGIYVSGTGAPVQIVSNTLSGNVANSASGGGGGIYVAGGSILLAGNTMHQNHAAYGGGGLYLTGDAAAQVEGNRIEGNQAGGDGGGVLVRSSGVSLSNNLIRENEASGNGHGVLVAGYSSPDLYHNTLVANGAQSGAGLYINPGSAPTVANNVVVAHAVGIYCGAPLPVACSVLGNTLDLDGTCSDSGNIYANPLLVDGLHLAPQSPAIDVCSSVGSESDIDGEPRPACEAYDAGADEYSGSMAHVGRMWMASRLLGGSWRLVLALARIVDQDGHPISGVTVGVVWTLPDGGTATQAKPTNSRGLVRFAIWAPQAGSYQICVTGVTGAVAHYCPSDNAQTCSVLQVP